MPDTTNEKDDVLDDGLVRRKPTFEELKTYKANQLRLFVRKFGFKTHPMHVHPSIRTHN